MRQFLSSNHLARPRSMISETVMKRIFGHSWTTPGDRISQTTRDAAAASLLDLANVTS